MGAYLSRFFAAYWQRIRRAGIWGKLGLGCIAPIVVGCCLMTSVVATGQQVGLIDIPPTPTLAPTRTPAPTETSVPTTVATIAPTDAPTTIPTVVIPTVEPTIVVPTAGVDPGVQAYAQQAAGPTKEVAEGLSGIGELFQAPRLTDGEWKLEVAARLAQIRLAHEQLTEIENVPPVLQSTHEQMLDATGDCNEATTLIASGLDNVSVDDLNQAAELMRSCGTKIQVAQKSFNEVTNP